MKKLILLMLFSIPMSAFAATESNETDDCAFGQKKIAYLDGETTSYNCVEEGQMDETIPLESVPDPEENENQLPPPSE